MTREEAMDKVRKLLERAEHPSTDPNESATSFARAQQIMDRYRIARADVPDTSEVEEEMTAADADDPGRVASWVKVVSTAVSDSTSTALLFWTTGERDSRSCRYFGRASQVDHAIYLHRLICSEIERLAKVQATGKGRVYANNFKLGAAVTVARRLKEQRESTLAEARAAGASTSALAVFDAEQKAADAWMRTQAGKVRVSGPIRVSGNAEARQARAAGARAGESVDLGGNRRAIGKGRLALGTGG